MRDLQRNRRALWFAAPTGTKAILDEYGNDTLEKETVYLPPARLAANVSANAGAEAVAVFGAFTDYSRTVSFTAEECPLTEGCLVWFGADVAGDANYKVTRVADSKNGFLIALRELSGHG